MKTTQPTGKLQWMGQDVRVCSHQCQRVHEAAQWRAFEVESAVFFAHGNGEGAERLAVLHVIVEVLGNIWRPWRSQNAAIAESPRTKLRGALEPANNLAGPQQLNSGVQCFLAGVMQGVASFHIVEDVLDFRARKEGTPVH